MTIELGGKYEILSLFKDYLSFMSQFFEIEDYETWVGTAMSYLDSYGTESDRHIFVIKNSDVLIGFAMVNNHLRFNEDGFSVAEFFVEKQHQAKNHGRELAEFVFNQFPGQWEVAVTRGNHDALSFWQRVVSDYTNGDFREWEIDSYDGAGFSFNNAKRAASALSYFVPSP